MASKVIQFLWPEQQQGRVEVKTRVTVAALSEPEWDTFDAVTEWLAKRKPQIIVNLTDTGALGGECLTLKSALDVLADQFDYHECQETNEHLAAVGINSAVTSDTEPPADESAEGSEG